MIFRRVGIRDEHARDGELRKLGEARRAAPRDGEIRGAVGLLHAVVEGGGVSRDAGLRVGVAHELLVLLAGEVDDLQPKIAELRERIDECLVDPVRALAAAHHEQRFPAGCESECGERARFFHRLRERAADGRAGDLAPARRKVPRAILESEQHARDEPPVEPVRLAGDRVRFMDECRQLPLAPGEDRRGRGEAAHAEHGIRLEVRAEPVAEVEAGAELEGELEERDRRFSLQADARHFLNAELRAALRGHGVDLLLRDDEHHLVSAVEEHLADGQPRK